MTLILYFPGESSEILSIPPTWDRRDAQEAAEQRGAAMYEVQDAPEEVPA